MWHLGPSVSTHHPYLVTVGGRLRQGFSPCCSHCCFIGRQFNSSTALCKRDEVVHVQYCAAATNDGKKKFVDDSTGCTAAVATKSRKQRHTPEDKKTELRLSRPGSNWLVRQEMRRACRLVPPAARDSNRIKCGIFYPPVSVCAFVHEVWAVMTCRPMPT